MTSWCRSIVRSGLTIALFAGFGVVAAWAGTQQVITLRDASVVRGEILEMKDGQYRIKSPMLGELKVPLDQVVSIVAADIAGQPVPSSAVPATGAPVRETRNANITIREGGPKLPPSSNAQPGRAPTAAKPAPTSSAAPSTPTGDDAKSRQEQVNTRVQSMMMNEDFFDKVTGLGQSTEMDAVMNDPEVMNAIQNLDYDYLMNNPKMKELMESQGVKDLLGGSAGE